MNAAPLDAALLRLRSLHGEGGIAVSDHGTDDWYDIMLFAPATAQQTRMAQASIAKRLPEDFLRFWRFSNGANLFLNESGLHGVGIASTEMIRELQDEEEEFYGEDALENYAVFARVNGGGDFLVFDLTSGRVLDGVHAEQPHEWHPVADSFAQWLERFLDEEGRYYWLQALYDHA